MYLFQMQCASKSYNKINNTYRCVRVWMVLLCFACGMVQSASAVHYIRFNADFSYARDFAPKGAQEPVASGITLAEAQQWIGAGMAEPLSASNGFSPAVGIGYRYMYNVLVIDAGLGVEYRFRGNRPYDLAGVKADHVDDTGEAYVGTHTWADRRVTMQNIGVHLPVMVGVEVKRIYALAGVKADVDVWGVSREKGGYTLTGNYARFMDELENVAGHGFVTNEKYEMPSVGQAMDWNVRACAEIGYCIVGDGRNTGYSRSKKKMRYYVGAFAEYAFAGSGKHYLPLLAGVRLTALLPLAEPHVCNCLGY